MATIEKTVQKTARKPLSNLDKELVLYNDDFNTFDHVIDTLIKVCNHDAIQAEQCAMLVHFKGKCTVKTGNLALLKKLLLLLLDAGLTAKIE